MESQTVKEKKIQKDPKRIGNKRKGQYEKLCDRITDLEQQIDRMSIDFKKEVEEVSHKNEKILGELKVMQELLRILIANELLDEIDILVQK